MGRRKDPSGGPFRTPVFRSTESNMGVFRTLTEDGYSTTIYISGNSAPTGGADNYASGMSPAFEGGSRKTTAISRAEARGMNDGYRTGYGSVVTRPVFPENYKVDSPVVARPKISATDNLSQNQDISRGYHLIALQPCRTNYRVVSDQNPKCEDLQSVAAQDDKKNYGAVVNSNKYGDLVSMDCDHDSYVNKSGDYRAVTAGMATNRASSPGNTSSVSSSSGSRITPMGSTTGLIGNAETSSSKYKVDATTGWMPGLNAALSILSLAVSLGNILRLPRVVYLAGGGTFLAVYICISLIFGIPLVFLEIGLGQFCQEGTTKLWRAVPLFKGVGYVKVLASALLSIYYPLLMTVSLFYFVWSAKGPLPFSECTQPLTDQPQVGEECLKNTFLKPLNEDFMWFGVNVAFLFLLWSLFMLCLFKSEQSYRISLFVIFISMVTCLVAILGEAILSDRSVKGIKILLTFHWETLLNVKVWYFAVIQVFFSTHLGFGNIVTCAGRLYSKNNALWAAVFYVISNLVVGILVVCIVYQWIGRVSGGIGVHQQGPPEGFIFTLAYDVAVHSMGSLKRLWASLIFLTFILAGFASMLAAVYTILVAATMEINRKWHWWIIAGCLSFIGFFMGVLCFVPHKMEFMHIMDHYAVGRMVLASTVLELMAFAWIYGCGTLYNDFEFVLGHKLNPIWKVIWFITPVLLVGLEVWSFISLPLTGLPGRNSDPMWVYTTGWALYFLAWAMILSSAVCQIHAQVDYNLSQKFLSTLKASRNWGPVDTIYRHWWVQWRVACTKTGQRDFTFKRRGTKDYTSSVQKHKSSGADPIEKRYRAKLSSASTNGTLQHSRGSGPFTIQTNGEALPEHVCWRGTLQQGREPGT